MSVQPIVIDLATGNIGSVLKMLTRLGARPTIASTPPSDLGGGCPVILPGVGHFSHAADALDAGGWRTWLDERHGLGRPVLGICLGAQLLCRLSEEGSGNGLGWIPTTVRRFPPSGHDGGKLRVPHMEWRPFTPPAGCLPFVAPHGRMYYAHSFYIEPTEDAAACPYQSEYGGVRFAAIVRCRRSIGVQFHPEKSHRHGLAFLRSWLSWAETSR